MAPGPLGRAFLGLLALWVTVPVAVLLLYSVATPEEYYSEKPLPTAFTLEHFRLLWGLGAEDAFINSVVVGLGTVALSFALGLPAGYALARYTFPYRDAVRLFMLLSRMFPLVVLGVSLLRLFITLGLVDNPVGLILAHTAMALPFVVIITASVFTGVPRDVEEAALVFGLTPAQAFLRITLPLAAPGLAAAAIFTFIMSWNEVFVASLLTLTNRTLPAFILVSALHSATDQVKFAAAALMVVPALLFIAVARRRLVSLWAAAR